MTGAAQLREALARLRRAEADAQPLALPRRGDRQHHVGHRRGRGEEEIGVDEEVEAVDRGAGHRRARLREEQVRAEAHHAAHRVGRAVEDRAVEIGRGHPALARGPERPLGQADGLRALLVGEQGERTQIVDRRARGPDVAARRVPAAGERVEQRERAYGLGRVGVLLEAGPVEVGHRPPLPEQPRRLDDLRGGDAGDPLDALRRVAATEGGVRLERGHARDGGSAARRAGDGAGERGLDDALHESPRDGIVRDRPGRAAVPRHVVAALAVGREVGGREQAAGVLAHQQRAVGPVADEVAIVPALRDHDRGEPEGERPVGAGPHAQPLVGARGRARAPRVHHDQGRAARGGLRDRGGLGQVGARRVVAPEQQAAGALEVRRADVGAEGERGGVVAVPRAQLLAPHHVGAAEGADEPVDPREAVGDRGARGGGDREGHRLRPLARRRARACARRSSRAPRPR